MQCYKYEALCRTLMACVAERYPHMAFDIYAAADAIDDYGIDDFTQIADIVSVARNIGFGIQLAA